MSIFVSRVGGYVLGARLAWHLTHEDVTRAFAGGGSAAIAQLRHLERTGIARPQLLNFVVRRLRLDSQRLKEMRALVPRQPCRVDCRA